MLQSRREMLKSIGVAASVLAASAVGMRAAAAHSGPSRSIGIHPGMKFGSCSVVSVGHVQLGAIPITLVDRENKRFRVDLLRYDPRSPGVARAGSLSVFLSNNGDGSKATKEEHGVAAMAVASHLARREAAGTSPPRLLTLAERAKLRQKRHIRT
jgi:hypothetical protein